mgnify:CR=1 FL=1
MILPGIPGSYIYKAEKLVKGVSGLRSFTKGNFRHNLERLIGKAPSWMKKAEAHHVLPQKFGWFFESKGFSIHDPRFGSWVDKASHSKWSWEYNVYWEDYINRYGDEASPEQIIEYARILANRFGFDVNF